MSSYKLSWAERLILWNQYEIMRGQAKPGDDTSYYDQSQKILEVGLQSRFSELGPHIDTEGISDDVYEEVAGILDMFSTLQSSARDLKYTPKSSLVEFRGFDGNNEGRHFTCASVLRKDMGLWGDLKHLPDNSHSMVLDTYRRMFRNWNALGKKHQLSAVEIEDVCSLKHSLPSDPEPQNLTFPD